MARIKNGNVVGIIGNVVFSSLRGTNILKKAPRKRSGSFSPRELANQQKFRIVTPFVKKNLDVIRIGYQETTSSNEYNEAMKYHLHNALKGKYPNLELDYERTLISRGLIPKPELCTMERIDNQLKITWQYTKGQPYANKHDEVIALLFDSGNKSYPLSEVGFREAGIGFVEIPSDIKGDFHVWIFYSDPKRDAGKSKQKISDSVYMGLILS